MTNLRLVGVLTVGLLVGNQPASGEVPEPTCWWKLDEGAGQVVSDSVGGFDGVLGTTTDLEPEDPQWLWYDEARQYVLLFNHSHQVLVPDALALDFNSSDQFTIALWVYKPSEEGAGSILGKRDGCGAGPMNYQFVDGPISQHSLHFNSRAGGIVEADRTLPQSSWSHLAATYGPGGDLVLYLNGGEVGRGSKYSLGWPTDAPLLFGNSGTCYGFGGLMHDVRLWRRTLEPEEVREVSSLFWGDFESGDTSAWSSTVE